MRSQIAIAPGRAGLDMESRNRFASDRHRPSYHFLPAANWLNDPNGLIQWQGQVHLFYQYNPHGPFHGAIHWGHAASRDLIHWEDWPVALAPTPGGPDQDGCWSGCAVDDGGKPVLVYTGGQCAEGGLLRQTQCLAMSDDGLHTWRKYPGNPVIASPPVVDGQALAHPADFRDPWVWREADGWYMAVGTWIRRAGGAVLLYRSPDLVHWEYLHPLLEGDTPGEMWECPNFFPLGDKYVLLVSLQPEFRYSEYYIGTYADHRFMPERRGIVDFGGYFYAPQTLLDERGRRLIWGWVQEGRSGQVQREAGWSGVMSLPRVLTLRPDGALGIAPAPELQTLRRKHTRLGSLEIAPDSAGLLPGLRGDCLEIVAEFRPGTASQCGLTLRRSPDGTEQTGIVYDAVRGELVVDRQTSSLDQCAQRQRFAAPLALDSDGVVRLCIFLDRSVLEVFAEDGPCLTSRVYPSRADSLGLDLVASGGVARLVSLDAWAMATIWG